jgi:hypothetical protein
MQRFIAHSAVEFVATEETNADYSWWADKNEDHVSSIALGRFGSAGIDLLGCKTRIDCLVFAHGGVRYDVFLLFTASPQNIDAHSS